MTKRELQELREIAAGVAPVGMRSENRRVALKQMGVARREDSHPWTWHLTDSGRDCLRQHLK